MKKILFLFTICSVFLYTSCNNNSKSSNASDNKKMEEQTMDKSDRSIPADTYTTEKGDLKITLVGHASLIFEFDGKIIHVDPYSNVANYDLLPKADLIILTHEHSDHMDTTAINKIKKADTQFIMTEVCHDSLNIGEIMRNGDKSSFNGVEIDAVPAYNMVNKRPDGEFYHPKGRGNGYVFTFADKKVYVAGDTENIPEMDVLKDSIYIAFFPKNLPYTMTDEMFIDATKKVNPTYLYPYHFFEYNEDKINKALSDTNTKVLLRPMSNK